MVWVILWVIGVEAGAVLADFNVAKRFLSGAWLQYRIEFFVCFIALCSPPLWHPKPVQKKGWRAFGGHLKNVYWFALGSGGVLCTAKLYF